MPRWLNRCATDSSAITCHQRLSRVWYQHRCSARKSSSITTAASNRNVISNKALKSRCSFQDNDLGIRYASTANRRNSATTREPWIDPSSLSESLAAHRKANMEGFANDGYPVERVVRRRKSNTRTSSRGSRISLSTKHLDIFDGQVSKRCDRKYEGTCPDLVSEWHFERPLSYRHRYPWVAQLSLTTDRISAVSAVQRLHTEIEASNRYLSPSKSEESAANKAFADIKKIIDQCLESTYSIDLVGSRAAGTQGPLSDLDINIRFPAGVSDSEPHNSITSTLRSLERRMRDLRYRDIVVLHTFIGKARVPVIIGTHSASGLEFQIQSTADVIDSLEVTKAFTAEYPTVVALYRVAKQMLLMRGLTKGLLGGVTAYPLMNMAVTSLKLANSQPGRTDIASQFLDFLNFWAEFDVTQKMITFAPSNLREIAQESIRYAIDPISAIPRIATKFTGLSTKPIMLILEDPADPSNNLGHNVRSIKDIQAVFMQARDSIRRNMELWDTKTTKSVEEQQRPLLSWCLGGDYTSFEQARNQLQRYTHLSDKHED